MRHIFAGEVELMRFRAGNVPESAALVFGYYTERIPSMPSHIQGTWIHHRQATKGECRVGTEIAARRDEIHHHCAVELENWCCSHDPFRDDNIKFANAAGEGEHSVDVGMSVGGIIYFTLVYDLITVVT